MTPTPPPGRVLDGVQIDHTARIERCRLCNAAIWFGRTRAGRSNPFDVVAGERTAVTHFSTCPRVRDWRNR